MISTHRPTREAYDWIHRALKPVVSPALNDVVIKQTHIEATDNRCLFRIPHERLQFDHWLRYHKIKHLDAKLPDYRHLAVGDRLPCGNPQVSADPWPDTDFLDVDWQLQTLCTSAELREQLNDQDNNGDFCMHVLPRLESLPLVSKAYIRHMLHYYAYGNQDIQIRVSYYSEELPILFESQGAQLYIMTVSEW